jgi:hypothetical protein
MYQTSVHSNDVDWKPARFPGVYLKILNGDPESEASVVLRKTGTKCRSRIMDHYRYSVSDPADPRFRATAVLEEEELLIDIRTALESGERSAVLNEPDQSKKIPTRFFSRYKSIRTSWWFGTALTLTAFYFGFALPRFPVAAQEHVDVPLPPYDPPPPASHHSETHDDQPPRVSRQTHSQSRVSPRPHPQPKVRHVKSSHHPQHHHRRNVPPRRHSFFHWPWQHHK